MTELLFARAQMAMSLGFHILFAVAGMALPVFMVLAEHRALRGDAACGELARRWAKGAAILFAVGAVSGTVLSFELGLLWPTFMAKAGPLVGMPFSLEGVAFFLEAIFLGIYLYGWDRIPPRAHLAAGVVVAISGLASGVFVVAVNGFMNTPAGFRVVDGQLVDVDVWRAFFNPAFPTEALHMALAAYASMGMAMLGVHAWRWQRRRTALHRAAVRVIFPVVAIVVPLQLGSGDLAAKHIARHQPAKLAAAEALFHTAQPAPLLVGGIPDEEREETRFGLEIPGGLSFLAHGSFDAEVQGLDRVPRDERPPVVVVHIAFELMVLCGLGMLGVVGLGVVVVLRRRDLVDTPLFLRAAMLATPLGFIALEAGWTVTEVGRQPWIIQGVQRTADAVTPMPGLWMPFTLFSGVYLLLGVVVLVALRRHVLSGDEVRA